MKQMCVRTSNMNIIDGRCPQSNILISLRLGARRRNTDAENLYPPISLKALSHSAQSATTRAVGSAASLAARSAADRAFSGAKLRLIY